MLWGFTGMKVNVLKAETEEALLQMIKAGEYPAFDELYARHFQTVYAMAYNILRDHEHSMDIVQDIFIWFRDSEK